MILGQPAGPPPTSAKLIERINIQAHFHFQDGLIIHTDDFDVWKWSKQALGIKEFYLVGLAICKKKYTKRQFHRLLDIKNYKMIETLKYF
jgi:hypothetical protein